MGERMLTITEERLTGVYNEMPGGQVVILMHGHPGAGKSYVARCLLEIGRKSGRNMAVVGRDRIKAMFAGTYEMFPRGTDAAAREMKDTVHSVYWSAFEALLASGLSVILDTTSRDRMEREAVFKIVQRFLPNVYAVTVIEVINRCWMLNRLEQRKGLSIEYWTDALGRHVKAYEPLSDVEMKGYERQVADVIVKRVVIFNDYRVNTPFDVSIQVAE